MSCGQCVNEAGLTLASSGVALSHARALFGISQRCAECGAFLDGRGQCNNPYHGRKVRAADAGFDGMIEIVSTLPLTEEQDGDRWRVFGAEDSPHHLSVEYDAEGEPMTVIDLESGQAWERPADPFVEAQRSTRVAGEYGLQVSTDNRTYERLMQRARRQAGEAGMDQTEFDEWMHQFTRPVRISPYDRLDEITEEIMGHRKIGVISLATGEDGRWTDGRLNFRDAGDLEMAEPGVRLVDRDALTTFERAGSGAWLPPEHTTPVQIYEAVWELDDRGLSLEAIGEQGKAKVRGEVGRGTNVEPRDLFVALHPREKRTVVVATYQVIE